jgi:hypothetical protein
MGASLLLSEPLPLRSTKSLGDFAEDAALPIIFGDLRGAPFPLLRLSDVRFFAADHPMQITAVYIDNQQTSGWERALESDDSGHTWTTVSIAAPVPPGSVVSAAGLGLLDSITGDLLENPAAIVEYVCALAGRADDFSELRGECSGLDLRFAGRLADRRAVKLHIDRILQSGAVIWWHGGARIYPSAADPSPILDLDKSEVWDIQVSANSSDVADVLRIGYDRSEASGRAQHFIELSASPQRYSGLVKEVTYDWLRKPQDAETIGRPVLQRLAGERYDDTFTSTRKSIRPGMWVRPVAHPDWPLPGADPIIMVLAVEIEADSDSVRVVGERIVGRSLVTVTGHSIALPDTVQAAIDVAVKDGVATFTITDKDGKPLAHARVALDGGAPKSTDAQGKVSFPVKPGPHTLDVEAVGYLPFTLTVLL